MESAATPEARLFTVWETALPARLGISRDDLRRLRRRHLVEHEDWIMDGRVLLCPAAVEKLGHLLAVPDLPPAPAPRPIVGLVVWKAQPRNRRVVLCHRPGEDPGKDPAALCTVTVRDNAHFSERDRDGRPVVIPCVQVGPGLYELAGRCPRAKGRPVLCDSPDWKPEVPDQHRNTHS